VSHNTNHREFPTCPHCGCEDVDGWKYFIGGNASTEVDCPECEKPYVAINTWSVAEIRLLEAVDNAAGEHPPGYLALGFCRYQVLKKVTVREFEQLHEREIAGERFDDMVDELVAKGRQ
jgi:hypothetical protein